MNKEQYIQWHLDESFQRWFRRASLWGAVLFVLLGALDYVVTPENFKTFLLYRTIIASFLFAAFIAAKKISHPRVLQILAYGTVIGSAVAIELMIMRFGGHASSYYVGMILLCVSVLGFIPARFHFHVVSAALIYAIYLFPLLITEKITQVRVFFTANAFMSLIFITAVLMRYLNWKGLIEDLTRRYDLERSREYFEEIAQDRTRELTEAKEQWEETFNTIDDVIAIHDKDFNVIRVNAAAAKMLGVSLSEIKKQKCYQSFHDTEGPPGWCPGLEVLKTGAPATREVFDARIQKHIEIKALPRFDKKHRIIGLIHIVRDITDRKRAEDEQRNLQAQFLQAQKIESIGLLAGGVAHDFNNILSTILGYSELSLMNLPDGHPARQNLLIIREAGEKAAALTHQLLAFSRKQVLEMKAINLNTVVEKMVKMLSRVIGEDVVLHLNTRAPTSNIMADLGQIEQILMNLAVNARDAMPSGGRMMIETADVELDGEYVKKHEIVKPGPYVMLAVSDTGEGMSKNVMDRIFDPFFTTKEVGKGTGLGLATVYGIVKQHNGYIFVYSEPGKGTTFKIYLPATHEKSLGTHPVKSATAPRGSETVLVADDEPAIRNLVLDVLRPLGYHVLIAASGEEALTVSDALKGPIDLLLTDVVMPGMDGKKLADELCSRRPNVKVVFMSGYTDNAIAHHGILDSGVILIQKPLTPGSLARKLREVLDKKAGGGV